MQKPSCPIVAFFGLARLLISPLVVDATECTNSPTFLKEPSKAFDCHWTLMPQVACFVRDDPSVLCTSSFSLFRCFNHDLV